MLILEIVLGIILLFAYLYFRYTKRTHESLTLKIEKYLEANDEMKKTLAMGLYLRFKVENEEAPAKYSSIFMKEDPISFEYFAAEIFQASRGGSVWVSPASNDQGVDFEHNTENGLYLGQVKCHQGDLSYEPIALIHSNMVKRGAVGGYVITTGSFTENARKYAEGLDIELIDGVRLVEEWLDGLRRNKKKIERQIS